MNPVLGSVWCLVRAVQLRFDTDSDTDPILSAECQVSVRVKRHNPFTLTFSTPTPTVYRLTPTHHISLTRYSLLIFIGYSLLITPLYTPAFSRRVLAISVFSQVNSGSVRPK